MTTGSEMTTPERFFWAILTTIAILLLIIRVCEIKDELALLITTVTIFVLFFMNKIAEPRPRKWVARIFIFASLFLLLQSWTFTAPAVKRGVRKGKEVLPAEYFDTKTGDPLVKVRADEPFNGDTFRMEVNVDPMTGSDLRPITPEDVRNQGKGRAVEERPKYLRGFLKTTRKEGPKKEPRVVREATRTVSLKTGQTWSVEPRDLVGEVDEGQTWQSTWLQPTGRVLVSLVDKSTGARIGQRYFGPGLYPSKEESRLGTTTGDPIFLFQAEEDAVVEYTAYLME
jgi:hypothetical protein